MHITDILFYFIFLAEHKTGYVLAIQQSQEIISFTKQVTPVSIVISNSKSTFVAILSYWDFAWWFLQVSKWLSFILGPL